MSVSAGLIDGYSPVLYRNVTAGDLTAVGGGGTLAAPNGAPKRRACFLSFVNNDTTQQAVAPAPFTAPQTAVFTGADGVSVTVHVAQLTGSRDFVGSFATIVSLGANVVAIAGWIDDGKVQLNP